MHSRTFENKWFLSLIATYLRNPYVALGRWRLMHLALPAARRVLRGEGRRVVRTRHGFMIEVDLDDWLGQFVYLSGEYEGPTTAVIKTILKPGGLFVDVGANIGYFTLLASSCVGPDGKVVAIEPLPDLRERLRTNIVLNDFRVCTVLDVAISDSEHVVDFFEGPAHHRGLSALTPVDGVSRVHRVRSLPMSVAIDKAEKIDLVKIDVEGAEFQVLRGMSEIFQAQRPDLIVEISDSLLRRFDHSGKDVCDTLRDWGYDMYMIDSHGLDRLPGWRDGLPQQFNALFTAR